jgi:hypothetical protein
MAGLLLTVVFGFEAPNDTLLLLSSGLLLTAVISVFAHLGFTRRLNRSQKRCGYTGSPGEGQYGLGRST